MTNEEAIAIIRKEYLCVDRDCDIERSCGKCDLAMPSKEPILKAFKMAMQALEQGDVLQEIWNKTYGLHPINRGDNDYANGVYDGMCRVIDIVCNTIDSKIKELSE